MSSVETTGGRGERRGGSRRSGRGEAGLQQPPWRQPRNLFRPVDLVSADELERIHEASLTILEEIGMDVLLPEAREIFRAAGASVEPSGQRVRADRGLILAAVANAPATFSLHARNPAHDLEVGGNAMIFSQVASPPNCSDLDRGRRPGTLADFHNLLRLAQSFNIIHLIGGYPVEPIDIHPDTRHLDALRDIYTLTDKVTTPTPWAAAGSATASSSPASPAASRASSWSASPPWSPVINTSSPLRLDAPMAAGIIEMSRAGQGVDAHPLHPRRRHGAGDGRRGPGAAERRGAGSGSRSPSWSGRARRCCMAASPAMST